jgi:hypothetical protein
MNDKQGGNAVGQLAQPALHVSLLPYELRVQSLADDPKPDETMPRKAPAYRRVACNGNHRHPVENIAV